MKLMKKLGALLLALTMVSALAACSDQGAKDSAEPSKAPETQSAEPSQGAAISVYTNAYFAPFEYYDGTDIVGVDVDVMNQQGSDDTVNNGNAWRPDNVSYNGQPNDKKKAGDQIIYESTPEAVAGYVQGYGNSNYSFSDGGVKDKASNHIHPGQAGTDTGPDGYSNQSHSAADTGGGGATGWIRSTLAKDQFGVGDNLDTLFYMMREYGSTTKEWSNYGQYKEKNNSDEKVALDGIPGKTTDAHWIGWTYRLFQQWWGQDDSVTGLHGSIKQTGSKEFTDRYYRLRLAGHSLGASLSYGWQDKVDGNTTTGQKLLAKWSSGTGPRKWPDQPVEPTIKDLGKGQDCGGDTIIAIADATSADGNGIYGSEDYKMLRNISDDLMWWAESRAIAQVSRIPAREFTKNWEGMGDKGFLPGSGMDDLIQFAAGEKSDLHRELTG